MQELVLDLEALEAYFATLRLHVVGQRAVASMILRVDGDHVSPRYGVDPSGVLERVRFPRDVGAYLETTPDAVLLTIGTQFGPGWRRVVPASYRGRVICVAGYSALSGSYAGITVRPWVGGAANDGLGDVVARFQGGWQLQPDRRSRRIKAWSTTVQQGLLAHRTAP